MRRDQVELDRSLMAQWMGKVGFELQPLADYVLERIKQGERLFADETTLPTLAPGPAKPKRPGYGPTPVTTDPVAAQVPRWRPIALKTAGAETVSRVIWRALGACCRWTVMRPAIDSPRAPAPTRSDAGDLFCPYQMAVLRTARERKLVPADADDHDNSGAPEGRRRHPRQGSRNTGESSPGKSAAIVARRFELWKRSCLACPGSQNSLRRFATPSPGGRLSNAS